jgi:hypothetical protein
MGRRRRAHGLILDLTRVEDGEVVPLDELIVKPPVPVAKEIILTINCGICGALYPCRRNVGEMLVCFMCYQLSQASDDVAAFLRDIYSKPCEFCGVSDGIKHMDHRNMFLKSHAIMDMNTMPLECIKAEAEKCQLLCIQCHKQVTSAEWKLGFMKKKKYVGKLRRYGKNVTKLCEKYAACYEQVMQGVYNRIKSGNSAGIIR